MPRRRRPSRRLFTFLLSCIVGWLLSVFHPLTPDQSGRVVGVHDGDTITVLGSDHREIKVRLAGIDAPELSQPYGQAAKQTLSRLVYGQGVTLSSRGTDRYQRMLAIVRMGETNINLEMVRAGMAWRYEQYSSDSALLEAQQFAQARRLGLWAAPAHGNAAPIPPWEWRKESKER